MAKIKLNYAHLCDYASVSPPGDKFNILGIFKNVFTTLGFPFIHSRMMLAIEWSLNPERDDLVGSTLPLRYKIDLKSSKGNKIISSSEGAWDVLIKSKEAVTINGIMEFDNVEFPKPGDYFFEIGINKEISSNKIKFKVIDKTDDSRA